MRRDECVSKPGEKGWAGEQYARAGGGRHHATRPLSGSVSFTSDRMGTWTYLGPSLSHLHLVQIVRHRVNPWSSKTRRRSDLFIHALPFARTPRR